VQGVGVGEDKAGDLLDPASFACWRIPIVDTGKEIEAGLSLDFEELPALVVRQRLQRIEVEGAPFRVGEEGLEDREIEGESLPRSGRSGDYHVFPCAYGLYYLSLVFVERDPLPIEVVLQYGRECNPSEYGRECNPSGFGLGSWNLGDVGDLLVVPRFSGELCEEVSEHSQ